MALRDQQGSVTSASTLTAPVADPVPTRRGPLLGTTLLAVAVVLAALNLRAAVTSASVLLNDISDGVGGSAVWVSVLTTAPTLCFAAAGLLAPTIARRIGLARSIGLALAVLSAGLLVRVVGGAAVMLGGTFVACAGIALANVLLPVVVKESFPLRIGLMTGIYTASLQGSGALGSGLTPSLEGAIGGWRGALALWGGLAVVALVLWALAARHRRVPATDAVPVAPWGRLLRSPVAWSVTAFMGLQSFYAYVVMGWLPQVLMDAGQTRNVAGLMLSLSALIPVPLSLIIPAFAARRPSQSGWNVGLTALSVAGVVGLLVAPAAAPWLWVALLGVGMVAFSMAMASIGLRTDDAGAAATLSAMAQGVGYLVASAGPLLFGLLHDASGGWTMSLVLLLVAMAGQLVAGALAGRPQRV